MNRVQETLARMVCTDKVRGWSMSAVEFRGYQFPITRDTLKDHAKIVQEAWKKDPTIKVFSVKESVVHDEYAVVSRRIPIPWNWLGL